MVRPRPPPGRWVGDGARASVAAVGEATVVVVGGDAGDKRSLAAYSKLKLTTPMADN